MNGCRIEWSMTKSRTPRVRRLSWYPRMDGRPASEREPVPLRRNRDFVLLQIGQALSTVGSEASGIAYTLLVLALTTHRRRPAWRRSRDSCPTRCSPYPPALHRTASIESG